MENSLLLHPIGVARAGEDGFRVAIAPAFRPALLGLEDFSWVQVLWWFSGCDNSASRAVLRVPKPYTHGPDMLGTFATRAPQRPNPLALSCARITRIDPDRGVLELAYLDAADGSPVLDLKPYTPSLDRVESPGGPDWCVHWPDNVESGGAFDWEAEFHF